MSAGSIASIFVVGVLGREATSAGLDSPLEQPFRSVLMRRSDLSILTGTGRQILGQMEHGRCINTSI